MKEVKHEANYVKTNRTLTAWVSPEKYVPALMAKMYPEWVKGKTLDEAGQLTNAAIAEELALPPVKIHCSILAEDAIKAAINDYRNKQSKE